MKTGHRKTGPAAGGSREIEKNPTSGNAPCAVDRPTTLEKGAVIGIAHDVGQGWTLKDEIRKAGA